MGAYNLQEERVNESPLYKKADEAHYIYRLKAGSWVVSSSRTGVDKGSGLIMTRGKAAPRLPTSQGVAWKFYDGDGKKWVPDGSMSVATPAVRVQVCGYSPKPPISTFQHGTAKWGSGTRNTFKKCVYALDSRSPPSLP